ncbi:YdeI/OmpD-associated family protein [Aestuariibaculum sediminum]|uniref:YdeI/OmpD-associated family protein n=1 Tax=Aestuariibaculum sediminum TaxID=2770637 RepID=A0A8J6QAC1_9FLAO|nr:YdeI/OmpD-associated family protein [Aestuariibaculum sediminum]
MELKELISNHEAIKFSFELLSKYKQREYCEFITAAIRDSTKKSCMEKVIPMLLQGMGLNDKYR